MSPFPTHRPRRLRENPLVRSLIQETSILVKSLIAPLFVIHGHRIKREIQSMPRVFQFSLDQLSNEVESLIKLGIRNVILFGIPETKNPQGSSGYAQNNLIAQAVSLLKKNFPELLIIADVCLCEYTDHGHCGLIKSFDPIQIDNDSTLPLLAQMAENFAAAGADVIAPSDMMDGRIRAIRTHLDEKGFQHLPILSYSVKYASGFYGPFREAAQSAPGQGDRSSYQMDPANGQEALREATLDIEEGADLLMVKPALPYLDVLKTLSESFSVPVGAYQVSGEYAMIKAAAQNGWIDEKRVVQETLTCIQRAGAQFIITYFAKDFASWNLKNS